MELGGVRMHLVLVLVIAVLTTMVITSPQLQVVEGYVKIYIYPCTQPACIIACDAPLHENYIVAGCFDDFCICYSYKYVRAYFWVWNNKNDVY